MAVTPTTLNPSPANGLISLSGGNLIATFTNVSAVLDRKSVFSAITGKYYFEVSFPARTGAVEGGVQPFIFETAEGGTYATYTRADYSLAGTIGVYFDLDANTMGCISPEGSDSGSYEVAVFDEGAPFFVGAMVYYDSDPGSPGDQVVTFNFGASAFYHSVPSGYEAGFGEPVSSGAVLTCPPPTLTATGVSTGNIVSLSGPSPAPLFSFSGAKAILTAPAQGALFSFSGASASLTAPSPAVAISSGGRASFTLTAPTPSLLAYAGASALWSAPSPKLASIGHDSTGEQAAKLTAPRPTLAAATGASSRNITPKQTLSASGTATIWGTALLMGPRPSLSTSGTVTMFGSAALLPKIQKLVGYSGAVCSVTTTGRYTLVATGITGSIGGASLTAPLFELVASATSQDYGSALLAAPSPKLGGQAQAWLIAPSARLVAIGTATVAIAYEAYALNLNHKPRGQGQEVNDELTRFTNYPFDKIIRYKNSYFGANSTGLYLLEGTTDDAAPIAYHAKTKLTDFGTDQKKTPEAAIFGGRLGPDATVTVYTGETEDDVYAYTTPRGQDVQNYRQKFGKGLKARYYAFGIQGDGAMVLDTVSFDLATLKRRI